MGLADVHFTKIFWFVAGICFFGAILSFCLIFIPVPKSNERFADTALIFWLSTAVSGGIGYLLGSSASNKSDKNSTGKTTAEINLQATTTTETEK